MSYASRVGRARVDPSSPSAISVCDRCGIWHNRIDLINQADWRGSTILPLYLFVCRQCLDVPQEQNRAIVLPADPVPIYQPRPEDFLAAESNYRAVSLPPQFDPITGIPIPSTTLLLAEDGQNMSTQVTGPPVGLDQDAQMPLYENVHYGVQLPILSVSANGTVVVAVTCSSTHGLVDNSQISAENLSVAGANGFFSVTVTSATAFTYQVNKIISAGPLLQGPSRIVTVLVGLPLGFTQIPQTGI